MPLIMRTLCRQRGFTLIELVMVIVLMGVIGGVVSVFMKSPIDAYFASARRAALTDVADTTVRRMARDIRKALPNSVKTTADQQCLEFIPTKTGGRYRTEDAIAGDGTSLSFIAADTKFNMLGSNSALLADQRIAVGDVIAVYNLGITGADAYNQDNTATVVAPAPSETGIPIETTITINSTLSPANGNMLFPLASGSSRFHVVPASEKVVAYVCSGNNLYRVARAALSHICPVVPLSGDPILARNVTCSFDYSGSDLQRNALVSMRLQLKDSANANAETVSLQHEVHVNNTP